MVAGLGQRLGQGTCRDWKEAGSGGNQAYWARGVGTEVKVRGPFPVQRKAAVFRQGVEC